MEIGCIVLNWNNYKDTRECISSILSSGGSVRKNIVLVDNFSTDSSYEKLRSDFDKKIHFLRNDKNMGYAGGINAGIRYILKNFSCRYIIAFNNDLIVHENFFDDITDVALRNEIDIISPVFCDYETKKVKFEGVRRFIKPLLHHIQIKGNYGKLEWWPAEVVMGAAIMFSIEFLENEFWFYEPFFLYCEEDEICVRAKMKGYKVGVCGKTVVYDKGKMSIKMGKQRKEDSFYLTVRNRFILAKLLRRYGYFSGCELSLFNICFPMACFLFSLLNMPDLKTSKAIMKGVKDGLKAEIMPHYVYGR